MTILYIVIGYFLNLFFVIGFFKSFGTSIRSFTEGWPHWALALFYFVGVPNAILFTVISFIFNGVGLLSISIRTIK